jgi:hypothetical protein
MTLLQRSTRTSIWLPLKELQSFAGHAQYMFLAIPVARFSLRMLHSVLGDKWGSPLRLTSQLRRDLLWWTYVLSHANRKRTSTAMSGQPTSTKKIQVGWEAVLNGNGPQRQTRSTRLLGNLGRAPSHHLEGIEGRPPRRPQFSTTS